jgi:hypothetical protein
MIKNFVVDIALGVVAYLVVFYALLSVGATQSREAASLAAAAAAAPLAMLVRVSRRRR